jgi:hypothetical protein
MLTRIIEWELLIIIGVAVTLLIVDRMTRIQPMLKSWKLLENFQMPILWGKRTVACGVGLESCPESTKCGNGLCIATDPVPLLEKIPLPVLPKATPTFQ